MIGPIVILLLFQLTGEVIARGLGLPVPGPVIGLVLLVCALWLRPQLEDTMRPLTSTLLGHLSLLFVPAGTGIVGNLDTVRDSGLALLAVLVISTALAIVTGAWVFALLARRFAPETEP
ncbi:CidA/LrgA family protein [Maribius pontilimi]|uniref:CidA/LrgA family protein n=1 Tax=Palleronia pontilimi TaxID=1964209 RepID=A0A934IEM5_9RHOB|nr:CidA/LrgA family protein [Palleronia pontilimi]MBJ3764226.1 CidA/LrgA family protein [Palleronia pontilimi]